MSAVECLLFLCVVITNQVTADPGAAAAFVQDAKKAVGGHIVAHITDTRVALRKGKGIEAQHRVVRRMRRAPPRTPPRRQPRTRGGS